MARGQQKRHCGYWLSWVSFESNGGEHHIGKRGFELFQLLSTLRQDHRFIVGPFIVIILSCHGRFSCELYYHNRGVVSCLRLIFPQLEIEDL